MSDVDQMQGSLKVLARLKLSWDEPNLGFCTCGEHEIKRKYLLPVSFEDFI